MRPEIQKYLYDVEQAGEAIRMFLSGMAYADFEKDALVQAPIERKFEIIGEALNRLGRLDSDILGGISNHKRIIGLRNILAHDYAAVDTQILWEASNDHLPQLLAEVRILFQSS